MIGSRDPSPVPVLCTGAFALCCVLSVMLTTPREVYSAPRVDAPKVVAAMKPKPAPREGMLPAIEVIPDMAEEPFYPPFSVQEAKQAKRLHVNTFDLSLRWFYIQKAIEDAKRRRL